MQKNSLSSGNGAQGGKKTPMMEQYIEIKAANPGSLLFYRMGDFYELFFEDAEIASRALGITLTNRGKYLGNNIPMCGVPLHTADDYMLKLVQLGHMVTVCDQLEDPGEAKKRGSRSVVRRGVIRLVTPGTITEEKLLKSGESNFLCALARLRSDEGKEEMALAWTDLSTGAFLTDNTSLAGLPDILSRVEPREIILSQTSFDQSDIRRIMDESQGVATPLPGNLFDGPSAEKRLCDYFSIESLDGFGSFSRCELVAAAAILAYLGKTQINEKPALSRPKSQNNVRTMVIDATTRTNLEISRTLSGERQGSLLKAVDRTLTGPGARELAQRLVAPLICRVDIIRRLDSVSFLRERETLLKNLRACLKNMTDMTRALSRLALNRGGPRDMAVLAKGFATTILARDALSGEDNLPEELQSMHEGLKRAPSDLLEVLENALSDNLPLLVRNGDFIRTGYCSRLDELRGLRDESRKFIIDLQASYASRANIKSLKIRHNNIMGYFIEIKAGNAANLETGSLKEIFIHRQTLANVMRFTTAELMELAGEISSAADRVLEMELEIFAELREKLVAAHTIIAAVSDALAALDVACSHATLAIEQNYCRPVISDDLTFRVENGRHPVIEQVLRKENKNPFISNNCDIGPPQGQSKGAINLLTGPNMGGKSTFLRQNALIALLAQAGSFVPAEEAIIGIVNRLFSRVGASDDLARGRSTFMVEMVETAAILNQANDRSLVILDEIGRGTATFDGLSIAWAAIEHLHEVNQCRTIFATHYHELVTLSKTLDRLFNFTMKVREWRGEVIFMHEVIPGAADRSYGIQVAKLAGLPVSVIARARAVLDQLENIERKSSASQIIDDLPLFNAVQQRQLSGSEDLDEPLAAALSNISPDELSPREALDKLYELLAILAEKKTS